MKNDPLSLVVAALCSLLAGALLSLVLLALAGCHQRPAAPAALVPAGLVIPEPAGLALDVEALPESSPVSPLVPVPQVPAVPAVVPSGPPAAAPLSSLVEVPALQAPAVAPSMPPAVLPWWRTELGRLVLCAGIGAAGASLLTLRIFGPRVALPPDEKSGSHRSQGPGA